MSHEIAAFDKQHLSAMVATGLAGIVAGSLGFVSAVDVRSFLTHIKYDKTKLVQAHFAIWWPYGRDWMLPLLLTTFAAHVNAYFATENIHWIIPGTFVLLIAPYTAFVLGEDIEALRKSDAQQVAQTARRFCNLHHARFVLALTGLGLSLIGLANL